MQGSLSDGMIPAHQASCRNGRVESGGDSEVARSPARLGASRFPVHRPHAMQKSLCITAQSQINSLFFPFALDPRINENPRSICIGQPFGATAARGDTPPSISLTGSVPSSLQTVFQLRYWLTLGMEPGRHRWYWELKCSPLTLGPREESLGLMFRAVDKDRGGPRGAVSPRPPP